MRTVHSRASPETLILADDDRTTNPETFREWISEWWGTPPVSLADATHILKGPPLERYIGEFTYKETKVSRKVCYEYRGAFVLPSEEGGWFGDRVAPEVLGEATTE